MVSSPRPEFTGWMRRDPRRKRVAKPRYTPEQTATLYSLMAHLRAMNRLPDGI